MIDKAKAAGAVVVAAVVFASALGALTVAGWWLNRNER
jgi:hypothetical protein